MTIVKHELRLGKLSLLIWTGTISFLLAVCIFLFPEMKGEMEGINDLFSSMGSFTAAFGMDKLNFGSLIGYYAIECGNVLGMGGAFYAALTAAGMLSKEEKERTAEFLLTHPVRREHVVLGKLAALFVQITAMNLAVYAISIASIAAVGEKVPWKELHLMHIAYYLLQLELGGICLGISAFLRKGSAGVGLGVAALMYILNLISNITESAKDLRYLTPFAYCDGATIVESGKLDGTLLLIGAAYCLAGILAAFFYYTKKDIHCA